MCCTNNEHRSNYERVLTALPETRLVDRQGGEEGLQVNLGLVQQLQDVDFFTAVP